MPWNFQEIEARIKTEVQTVGTPQELEAFRLKYLGKKGLVHAVFASLGQAAGQEKAAIGKGANDLKKLVEELIEAKAGWVKAAEKFEERADISLPGAGQALGHTHLLTQTMQEITLIFERMGFITVETPEIETEFHNFTGLNIPVDHPSRDAFDTFYLDAEDPSAKGRRLLLRSHTSPGQVRIMKEHKPPLAVIVPGRVYRPDAVDASHSFMFHQVEGLLVDEKVSFCELKGLLQEFCRRFFGPKVVMRFRPHFFPFTEPSAEVDIDAGILGIERKKWLEILGCGMVNPRVFEAVGYSKGKYKGLAFGMGVERMAMLKYGINDIRLFYENDVRFLRQF
ncbi:MAG: phenylalanine--tRNA ligase subunit alpha [Candidatus Omnitrophica bacterium]|nr:phenylalanine--tRNA ligase subunit alpha [Candidatus Omnitrophota bacterium]MDE2009552.1 phenylalanine--tRNA ligase subunit alpha [Candidatus Omnitrophota bacterium]MDE2214596.1 phenylalanine--tRNA ligase subunit alpha [Candidatus Omnitrophota bacterium]MDE2231673.1 phenylalanine--tRNA ligase subunit alpha [Candidatus Omnitrophota bacterium]